MPPGRVELMEKYSIWAAAAEADPASTFQKLDLRDERMACANRAAV